ncbi:MULTISPECIES: enoyl-CoA hydratase/isomerase family protein [unclassified Nitratireductor]|uniref:enoyl-CoA hydratase/isomerase family protein n=1 Tax=unclassified Nitratireductor TaxID=2641084 RepID=UPI0025EB4D64|nr:enoyl-CoA hydratase-related protein [Nitratireductor sp.]
MSDAAPSPTTGHILSTCDENGVLIVTIDRPKKRNALSLAMWQELGNVFRQAATDANILAVVLTGAGGHFSAGADISEFPRVRATAEQGLEYDRINDETTLAIRDCPRPVFAAVSGVAVGGGLSLALACDFRVADETSRMGIPAGRLGLVYSVLDSRLLTERVGTTRAKQILMSAQLFSLEEAEGLSLVDYKCRDNPLEHALLLASSMAQTAPLSLAGNKTILNAIADGSIADRADEMESLIAHAFDSEDYREGQAAFRERRPARFKGC